MKVAFGIKAHSGWAALVVAGLIDGKPLVVDRRKVTIVEEGALWAKQPYHAAEGLNSTDARKLVERGIDAANRLAIREMRKAAKQTSSDGHEVSRWGLLVGTPMPDWTVDEVRAVHFRMHKAEGVLFRDAFAKAAAACQIPLVQVPEKTLLEHASKVLGKDLKTTISTIAAMGKSIGPPWGKDQKDATLAAVIALKVRS